MPTVKLGQLSSLDIQKTEMEHFDVDMKIRDLLSVLSLVQKKQLLSKLPTIASELETGEKDINTGE